MKRNFLPLLTAVALGFGLTGCSTSGSKSGAGPVALFNGRDLDGWQYVLADPAVARDAVWSVRDGEIVCRGEPLGVLYSKASFTSFRLELEYRWAPGQKPGNSGILTRINGPARALPRCAEVQLQHGNAGDVLGLHGLSIAAAPARRFEVKAHPVAGDIIGGRKVRDAEKPAGEWNRVEVLAQGESYAVWLNGQLINEVPGVEVVAGPIGLQSEGGEIHFRRVGLTPLAE